MKRLFDFALSVFGIIVFGPLLLVTSVAILLTDGRPVFFRQERVGKNGKPFRIFKFRTMVNDAEKMGAQITVGRDPRITWVGAILRKTKLDELPQLFNVFAGQMSFVGPRPEVPHYVDQYDDGQRAVLKLMPGITDPASIRYRHESEILAQAEDPEHTYVEEVMPEKIRINLEYADRSNVVRDTGVILETCTSLFRKAA